jgi:hypothetical protein
MRVKPRTDEIQMKPMDFPDCTKIPSHTIEVVPRYAETDQSGVIHHTVYRMFENGPDEAAAVNDWPTRSR